MEWSGHALGLDWPAVKVLLDAAGIALDAALLGGLRTMEREALQVCRERRGESAREECREERPDQADDHPDAYPGDDESQRPGSADSQSANQCTAVKYSAASPPAPKTKAYQSPAVHLRRRMRVTPCP